MKEKMNVAEIAFRANKLYYDTCLSIKGNVNPKDVDFDAYAYFTLESVPEEIDFRSKSKAFDNPKARIKEFRKYLCFIKPENLDACEGKVAESRGIIAVSDYLNTLGFKSYVDWNYWN